MTKYRFASKWMQPAVAGLKSIAFAPYFSGTLPTEVRTFANPGRSVCIDFQRFFIITLNYSL